MFYLLSHELKGIVLQEQKDTHTHMHRQNNLNYLKDSQVNTGLQYRQFDLHEVKVREHLFILYLCI